MRLAVAVLALLAAVSAGAATIASGDVAVSPYGTCYVTCPPIPPGTLLTKALATKASLGENGALAFATGDRLYVQHLGGIDVYDASLTKSHVNFSSPAGNVAALAVAANGDLVVLNFDTELHIYSAAGAAKQTFALPATVGVPTGSALDLAPDQCTVFYIDGIHVRRFNICTAQPLSDVPGSWSAVRAFADGGYVVATTDTVGIFDANDHLVRTLSMSLTNPWAMAFDVDPSYVWIANPYGSLLKVQLANGSTALSGSVNALWLAVNGEQRPASALAAVQDIPTLSPALLFVVALGLLTVAWAKISQAP